MTICASLLFQTCCCLSFRSFFCCSSFRSVLSVVFLLLSGHLLPFPLSRSASCHYHASVFFHVHLSSHRHPLLDEFLSPCIAPGKITTTTNSCKMVKPGVW
ncbi:hypothetical protein BT93_C1877 [Corymbia citriodora subsp. variegata]|nr:hypothetical protein BT93_C1877 [Corymbia citriodora subsp. variegata]